MSIQKGFAKASWQKASLHTSTMGRSLLLALTWATVLLHVFAGTAIKENGARFARVEGVHVRDDDQVQQVPSVNVAAVEIEAARVIVDNAIKEMSKLNKARLENPARNKYTLKPSTLGRKRDDSTDSAPPLLDITSEIARAAALIANVDASSDTSPSSVTVPKRDGRFWMEGLDRKGTVPWGNDTTYKV